LRAGERVVCRAWKYNGLAHWVVPGLALGSDEHGEWVYQPAGSFVARPGMAFFARSDAVCLIPAEGEWVATFHSGEDRNGLRLYIDLSTAVGWASLGPGGWEAHSIDMDLDVVRVEGERGTWIDDEDEWDEHRVRYGYPAEVQQHLEALAADLAQRVRAQQPPFDDASADVWLDRLEALALAPRR